MSNADENDLGGACSPQSVCELSYSTILRRHFWAMHRVWWATSWAMHQVQNLSTPPQVCVSRLRSIVLFVNKIRLLGVTVDLSFDQNVSDVIRSCKYHIRSLRHIRPLVDRETAVKLACSIVASRLDCCNSAMHGVRETNIAKLQRMQNNLLVLSINRCTVLMLPNYCANCTDGCNFVSYSKPFLYRITYKVDNSRPYVSHAKLPTAWLLTGLTDLV